MPKFTIKMTVEVDATTFNRANDIMDQIEDMIVVIPGVTNIRELDLNRVKSVDNGESTDSDEDYEFEEIEEEYDDEDLEDDIEP